MPEKMNGQIPTGEHLQYDAEFDQLKLPPKLGSEANPSPKRARGRPRVTEPLVAVTLRLPPSVIERFKTESVDWRAQMVKVLAGFKQTRLPWKPRVEMAANAGDGSGLAAILRDIEADEARDVVKVLADMLDPPTDHSGAKLKLVRARGGSANLWGLRFHAIAEAGPQELAALLRNVANGERRIDPEVVFALADMLDSPKGWKGMRLKTARPRGGSSANAELNLAIFRDILLLIPLQGKKDADVFALHKKYGASERQIRRLWVEAVEHIADMEAASYSDDGSQCPD